MRAIRPAAVVLLACLALAAPAAADTGAPPSGGEFTGGIDEAPEITIIQRDDATIEEYRVGGQIYMIKVTPKKGIPYFLVDTDGDGRLDSRRSELAEDLMVPSWTLFRW
jgi:hypothetical protein